MSKKIPMRVCVGCNEMKPKREMIRVIRTPQEEILLDETGKQNGRGAYLCKAQECLEKALKRKGLERSLKIKVPAETIAKLKEEMSVFADE